MIEPTCIATESYRGHEARLLRAGDLEAVFLPALGMLGASLTLRGEEVLGRTDELDRYVEHGATVGIPLLHPWANRIDGFYFEASGRSVVLDRDSPLLHYDARRLPMHGVPGAKLAWEVTGEETDERSATLSARLSWMRRPLLEVFPFPHWLDVGATLDAGGLTIETTLTPAGDIAVPVSFGHHPYFRLPGTPRAQWQLELPAMRRLQVDERQIPTGVEEIFSWAGGPLGDRSFDDGFHLPKATRPRFTIAAGERHLTVAFLEGYPYAQIYAPRDRDFIAIEPMTAPGNALISRHGLRTVAPGGSFRAAFRIEL